MAASAGRNVAKLQRPGGEYVAYHRQEPADGNQSVEVVILNGFRSDMSGNKVTYLQELCGSHKCSSTSFDYLGHGLSTGDFTKGTLSRWLDDTLAVIDEVAKGRLILVGSSMGAWLMILAALRRPERIHALIAVAAAPDFTEDLLWDKMPDAAKQALMTNGFLPIPSQYTETGNVITRDLIEDARQHLILRNPVRLATPLHLLHGTGDTDVPWTQSQKLFDVFEGSNVALTLIKGGNHRLSTPSDLNTIGMVLVQLLRTASADGPQELA